MFSRDSENVFISLHADIDLKDKGLDQPHAAIEVAEICLCSPVQCEDFLVGISRKDISSSKGQAG